MSFLSVDSHYDLFQPPDQETNNSTDLFRRSKSVSKIQDCGWALSSAKETTTHSTKYLEGTSIKLNEVLDNETHPSGLHKTWSTPYLSNKEELTDSDENGNKQYLNLLNVSQQWQMKSLSSGAQPSNSYPSNSNSNSSSLLKDAINNNIEKSWLTSLKGISRKQLRVNERLESYRANDGELVQYRLKHSNGYQASFQNEKDSVSHSVISTTENNLQPTESSTSQPSFLLSTNLESLSPIAISLNELSLGGSPVSPIFPSDKLVYLDSPIRITIMGSKQVGKSALAVRYLSRNESSSPSSSSHAHSTTIQGTKEITHLFV